MNPPESNARIQAALDLLNGSSDWRSEAIRKRGTRRLLVITITILVAVGILAVVIGSAHRDRARPLPPISAWRTTTATTLTSLSLVALLVVVLLLMAVRGSSRSSWTSPLLSLSWSERRQLMRQVTGKAAVDEDLLPLTRETARSAIRQRFSGLTSVPILMNAIATALRKDDTFLWGVAGAVVVFAFPATVVMITQTREG